MDIEGTVVGWLTLPQDDWTYCSPGVAPLFPAALEAAEVDAGVNVAEFNRVVVLVPGRLNGPCNGTAGGLAMGPVSYNTVSGEEIVIPGGALLTGQMQDIDVLAHEFGHVFGLGHANALECRFDIIETPGGSCTVLEQLDPVGLMGNGPTASHFNAPHKHQLGWFTGNQIVSIVAPGTYTYRITPIEVHSDDVKSVRVLKGIDESGKRVWYYTEFRQLIGFDDNFWYRMLPPITSGITVYQATEITPGRLSPSPLLLDMAPQTSFIETFDFRNSSLVADGVFEDPSGITIRVLDVVITHDVDAYADVEITVE